jgi:hypothetical protein
VLIGVRLHLKSTAPVDDRESERITRVEPLTPAPSPTAGVPLEQFTQPPLGASGLATAGVAAAADSLMSGDSCSAAFCGLADSLYKWEAALEARRPADLLSFYDSLRFRYPGGDYAAWAREIQARWPAEVADSVKVDSTWNVPVRPGSFETHLQARFFQGPQVLRREWVMIWLVGEGRWRIVRQKEQAVP